MIISKMHGMRHRIIKQLSSPLTLDEICPTWADKLKLGLTIKDKRILSYDSKYCLVGEAWGFTGRLLFRTTHSIHRVLDLHKIWKGHGQTI